MTLLLLSIACDQSNLSDLDATLTNAEAKHGAHDDDESHFHPVRHLPLDVTPGEEGVPGERDHLDPHQQDEDSQDEGTRDEDERDHEDVQGEVEGEQSDANAFSFVPEGELETLFDSCNSEDMPAVIAIEEIEDLLGEGMDCRLEEERISCEPLRGYVMADISQYSLTREPLAPYEVQMDVRARGHVLTEDNSDVAAGEVIWEMEYDIRVDCVGGTCPRDLPVVELPFRCEMVMASDE